MLNKTAYHGWKSHVLSTGKVELVMPEDIGPRIMRCGFVGKANLFHNVNGHLGGHGESEWMLRGGHRLWHSPEDRQRTYVPDNGPVGVKLLKGSKGLVLTQEVEASTGLRKSLRVEAVNDCTFRLTHTLENVSSLWPVSCAPWALTVLERGGYAVVPLPEKISHEAALLPNFTLVPWAYTDMSLPVWNWRRDAIGIDTTQAQVPQKIGLSAYPGWSLYWQKAGTFVKYAAVEAGAVYPDFGCAFETFCNDFMIELETLAPLVVLERGQRVEHVEYWGLFEGLPRPDSDAVLARKVRPVIEDWLRELRLAR